MLLNDCPGNHHIRFASLSLYVVSIPADQAGDDPRPGGVRIGLWGQAQTEIREKRFQAIKLLFVIFARM